MARYVWKGDGFYSKDGERMPLPFEGEICTPTLIKDIPEYRSPIDGSLITSRSARREDMKKHGCVEYEPSLSPTQGKIKNKRFAAKHGLSVSEEFR